MASLPLPASTPDEEDYGGPITPEILALEQEEIDAELLALATPAELAAYETALKVEAALLSPLDYAVHVTPTTERYKHVEYLNRILVALVEGTLRHPRTGKPVRKLMISEPPRHGKSYHVSDHMPAWYISRYPDRYVAVVGYEADFAATWGRRARQHVEDHPEFGVQLDPKTTAANRWLTLQGGGMFTSGVGGPLTGKGFHLGVIDDPIKNAEDAASTVLRDKAWEWYQSTFASRLEPGAVQILMLTRWHEDDIAGRLQRDQPDEWYVVNLPAIAEEDDPLGRPVGAALCPERYPIEELHNIRRDRGTYWFGAMYQGHPYSEGLGIFSREHFRYWTHAEEGRFYALANPAGQTEFVKVSDCVRFQTVDLAASKKSAADWTVISTWDCTPDRRLVLIGRVRQRLESSDHIKYLARTWDGFSPHPKWATIEQATYGLALIQMVQNSQLVTRFPIRPIKPDTDKISRAIPAGALLEAGRIYFPAHAPWLDEWERELLAFPNGTHDDQVDTLSFAVHEVTRGALQHPRSARKAKPFTMQERMDAHADRVFSKRRKQPIHPELGRIR